MKNQVFENVRMTFPAVAMGDPILSCLLIEVQSHELIAARIIIFRTAEITLIETSGIKGIS